MYESTIHSKYKGKFKISLYGENSSDPSQSLSSSKRAYFSFNFNRNSVIVDGSLDTYKITLPDGCVLDSLNTSISTGGVRNGNIITYSNSPYSKNVNNTNTIVMFCSVDKLVNSKNQIDVSAKVEETIGEKTFTYMDSEFEPIPLLEYYEKHPLAVTKIDWKWTENEKYLTIPSNVDIKNMRAYLPTDLTPLSRTNFPRVDLDGYLHFRDNAGKDTKLISVYNIFDTVWLQNIVTVGNPYKDEIVSYVKDTYLDEASITDDTKKLPGLKVTKYPTTNGFMWKYEIEENFVGYARTANVDFTENNYMYFSTTDSSTLNEAFKMYLDTYPYQGVDKTELKNLVVQYENGVSDILKLADVNGDIFIDGKLVFHYEASDNRLELVKEAEEPDTIIHIPFNDEATMKATFESELKRIYSDLSESTITKINTDNDILTSILKNSTLNSNKESYSEYFIVQDTNKYLQVNVYSSGIDYTDVTVSTLDAKLENDVNDASGLNKMLKINLSSESSTELKNMINALDRYFIHNEAHDRLVNYDDYVVAARSGNTINAVYSIPEKRAYASFDKNTTTEAMIQEYKKTLPEVFGQIVSKETVDYILSIDTINKLNTLISPGYYMIEPTLIEDGEHVYTPGTPQNYYFVVPGQGSLDKDKYLLFNVYTGGYDKVYVTISELASKEENGSIKFELSDNNQRKLFKIVRALDFYFKGSTSHNSLFGTSIQVEYPITSTASIQDSIDAKEIKEVSASFKASKANEQYLELKEVSDENTTEKEENSIKGEKEDKKYSTAQDTETNNTTEETEETSSDDSYVPSSNASNVDAVPSSDGGTTNTTSSITDEVIGVNSSPTSGVPLVEVG